MGSKYKDTVLTPKTEFPMPVKMPCKVPSNNEERRKPIRQYDPHHNRVRAYAEKHEVSAVLS